MIWSICNAAKQGGMHLEVEEYSVKCGFEKLAFSIWGMRSAKASRVFGLFGSLIGKEKECCSIGKNQNSLLFTIFRNNLPRTKVIVIGRYDLKRNGTFGGFQDQEKERKRFW